MLQQQPTHNRGATAAPGMAGGELKRPNVWLRLTSSYWQQAPRNNEEREKARRSRLTSWILLGLFIIGFILLAAGIGDPPTLIAVVVVQIGVLMAAALNRFRHETAAGLLMVTIILAAILGADLSAPALDPLYLPSYDLFVIAIVVAASILAPWTAFVIAGASIVLISLSFFLQPHAPDLQHDIDTYGALSLLVRPYALQLIIATVSFLWVIGTKEQTARADRAEEFAEMERRELENKRQIEAGAQHILQVHTRLANGDYSTRASVERSNPLWAVGQSLNNLISRFQTQNQMVFQQQRLIAELERLSQALDDVQAGRPNVLWPAEAGTPLDPIIRKLRQPALLGQRNQNPGAPMTGHTGMGRGAPDPYAQSVQSLPPNMPAMGAPPAQAWGPMGGPAGGHPSGPGYGQPDPSRAPYGSPYQQIPTEGWPSLNPGAPYPPTTGQLPWSAQGQGGENTPRGDQQHGFPTSDNPWFLPADQPDH